MKKFNVLYFPAIILFMPERIKLRSEPAFFWHSGKQLHPHWMSPECCPELYELLYMAPMSQSNSL